MSATFWVDELRGASLVNTPLLERLSKALAASSVIGIVLVALVAHPDLTWPMRLAVVAGLAAGWFASATRASEVQATCLLAAPLLPAMLRGLTGKEGPVLDLLWMAPLTTSIVRTTAWSQWVMPAGWRVAAGGWALGLALVRPIMVAREVGFDLGGLWDLGRNNSDIGISAPHAAMWSLYATWTPLAGLLWVDVISARAARASEAWGQSMWSLWVGGTVATLIALYQGSIDLGFVSTPFWAARARRRHLLDANGTEWWRRSPAHRIRRLWLPGPRTVTAAAPSYGQPVGCGCRGRGRLAVA